MKILFSPSESKKIPQEQVKLSPFIEEIYQKYCAFVQNAQNKDLQKMWGYKKIDEIEKTRLLSLHSNVSRAVELYEGVAYDALDFSSLKAQEQEFILQNVLICSNLFGMVEAKEFLPFYKLKQGEGFPFFESKELYRQLEQKFDAILQEEFVIDLRAEFYKKLYKIKSHHFSFEFLKNGKRVSHYAKYYRGLVLREIAQNQGIAKIENYLKPYGLDLIANQEEKKCTTLVFAIS